MIIRNAVYHAEENERNRKKKRNYDRTNLCMYGNGREGGFEKHSSILNEDWGLYGRRATV